MAAYNCNLVEDGDHPVQLTGIDNSKALKIEKVEFRNEQAYTHDGLPVLNVVGMYVYNTQIVWETKVYSRQRVVIVFNPPVDKPAGQLVLIKARAHVGDTCTVTFT